MNPGRRRRRSRRGRGGQRGRRSGRRSYRRNPSIFGIRLGGGGLVGDAMSGATLWGGAWVNNFLGQITEKQLRLAGKIPWWGTKLGVAIVGGFLFRRFVRPLSWLARPMVQAAVFEALDANVPVNFRGVAIAGKTGLGDYAMLEGYGSDVEAGVLGAPPRVELLGDYATYNGLPSYAG